MISLKYIVVSITLIAHSNQIYENFQYMFRISRKKVEVGSEHFLLLMTEYNREARHHRNGY